MNKTLKKVLSGVISASMLCSALAIPHTALADDALPTDGLLMDITFDETGTSSGSFNATVGGTITEHGSVSYVDNYDGSSKALSISTDAAGNYLELPKGLLNGKDAATFSFWIKPSSRWAFMTTPVSDKQNFNYEKYLGMLASSSGYTVERYNNSGTRLSSVNANASGDWQYVTAVFAADGTKVYVNGNLITEENYDVVFENAQNAGIATCTVTGKGEFSGQVQTTFEIKKAEQQITNVPEDRKVVYGQQTDIEVAAEAKTTPVLSSDKEDVISVTEDGKLQINGVGTAVITITAPESDNYLAATASFKVTVMGDLSKATIAPVASVEYTGKVIVPELTITDGTYQLVKDVDYTVSGQRVSVGKATATIRGIDGRYAGSQTVTFEIVKAKQEIQVASKSIEVTEGTDPFVLAADGHGTLTFVSSAPAVAEIDDTGLVTVKAAGFTDITIKTAGTTNYEAAETVVRLTVKKKADTEDPDKTTEDSSDSTTEEPTTEKPSTEEPTTETPDQKVTLTAKNTVVTVPSVTYTGKAQKPAVKVTVSGKALSIDDYSVAYSNNKNAGIAKVVITGKGNYTGKVESTFVIKKASQTIQKQTVYAYSKYVKMKASAKGKVTYTSSNKKIATVNKKTGFVTAKKPGKVQIKVTAAATANYKKSTGTITLIVVPATPTVKKAAAYKTKAIKVSYKKVSGASGYQITYATNKAFKNAKSTYVSSKKSSAVIKNLKKGKKYYVKVRAYKKINGKKFYSVYSGKTSVKTK